MRHLNQLAGGTSALSVSVLDAPVPGVANHRYAIQGFNTAYNPCAVGNGSTPAMFTSLPIIFQNGFSQHGNIPNGVTEEALLSVISHHLRSKQHSAEATMDNQLALDYVLAAMDVLRQRDSRQMQSAAVPFAAAM